MAVYGPTTSGGTSGPASGVLAGTYPAPTDNPTANRVAESLALGGGTLGAVAEMAVNPATTVDALAQVQIASEAIANKPLVVQGLAGQTGNLLEAQSSVGTSLFAVSAAGNPVLKPDATITNASGFVLLTSTGGALFLRAPNFANLNIADDATTPVNVATGGGALTLGSTAATIGFYGKAAVARTATYTAPTAAAPARTAVADTDTLAITINHLAALVADLKNMGILT